MIKLMKVFVAMTIISNAFFVSLIYLYIIAKLAYLWISIRTDSYFTITQAPNIYIDSYVNKYHRFSNDTYY